MSYRDAISPEDARRDRRFPTEFEGVLIVDRERITVVVTDISRTGAMVRATGLPPVATEVVLEGAAFDVVATIMWRNEESCGLKFHRAVDPLEVVRKTNSVTERLRAMGRGWGARRPIQPD